MPPAPVRPGRDDDAPIYIALIERCWSDYPACVLDVDAEAPELRALAAYYQASGGAIWLTDDGAGMIATRPGGPHDPAAAWEICRVYVHPDRHGTGLGADLLALAERHAIERGASLLFLWTDTRFARAHRFYEKHGYARTSETRELHDMAESVEYQFVKPVPAAPAPQVDSRPAVSNFRLRGRGGSGSSS